MNMAERVLCEAGPWHETSGGMLNSSMLQQLRAKYALWCTCS